MNHASVPSAPNTIWYRLGELYLRGFLVLLAILLVWYLIDFLWSTLQGIAANPEITTAVLVSFVLLPLPLGWVQHNLVRKAYE